VHLRPLLATFELALKAATGGIAALLVGRHGAVILRIIRLVAA
jgi:hypothetical protein